MPYKDPKKRREAERRSRAKRRATPSAQPLSAQSQNATPEMGGRAQPLASAQSPRAIPEEAAMLKKWAPLAAYMERNPGKIEAISKSLAERKLGSEVRFGVEGPTFEEIVKVLA